MRMSRRNALRRILGLPAVVAAARALHPSGTVDAADVVFPSASGVSASEAFDQIAREAGCTWEYKHGALYFNAIKVVPNGGDITVCWDDGKPKQRTVAAVCAGSFA